MPPKDFAIRKAAVDLVNVAPSAKNTMESVFLGSRSISHKIFCPMLLCKLAYLNFFFLSRFIKNFTESLHKLQTPSNKTRYWGIFMGSKIDFKTLEKVIFNENKDPVF